MNRIKFLFPLFGLLLMVSVSANAQKTTDPALESITAAELRDHIFFLASDYLKGRIATTPEYEIAAQYVATQFAAAGLQPAVKQEDGSMGYLQSVPFAKTSFRDDVSWTITRNGEAKELIHKEDFKVLFGNNLTHENLSIVWVGYGIEEPGHKWNDFKDLDVKGKIMICISGAPMKKGKPVLPQEIHDKYFGMKGIQSKIGNLFTKDAAGIILIDLDSSTGMPFDMIPGNFSKEKYVFKGGDKDGMGSMPSLYIAKPEFLNVVMGDSKNNPMKNPDDILSKYKTAELKDTYLNSSVEILSEVMIGSDNVVGLVPGTDPALKNEYIVVGGHLDHVAGQQGKVCNGADDNASGASGVMEVAGAVAMNPGKRSVIFIAYTAEEMGLFGSKFFLTSDLFPKGQLKFNINMDMIGRTDPKNEATRAHYVVTNKKYVKEMEAFISQVNDGITDFPLIYDDDETSPGGSDHQTFISDNIPAFFFFSGVHKDLHNPGDDAEKIDYPKAQSISRLAYLIAEKLANTEVVPDFLEK